MNPIHLMRLKLSVERWNAWRKKKPTLQPNLRKISLRRFDLSGANLSNANLRRADFTDGFLSGVDFSGADLKEANLHGTRLISANLSGADLTNAILSGADLKEANLSASCLRAANLSGANLTHADLTKASLDRTILAGTALTYVRGLDSCRHWGPSIIDYQTLLKSGQLSPQFLRDCGFPGAFIEALPALRQNPIQFYSCFISYSSKDEGFVRQLHTDLQAKDVRCWFSPEDMKIGDEFRSQIDQAIHNYDRLLLILSEHSLTSRWVQKEVETAFEKEDRERRTVLFPVRLDEAVMGATVGWAADIRRQRYIGDFTRWKDPYAYRKVFERLLRDLTADEKK